MDGHFAFGLVVCVGLFIFFMMRGKTRDVRSIVAVVLGCVAIMIVCANWDTISHFSSFAIASNHAPSSSVPTPAPTVAVTPTPVPHPTPTAVQAVSVSSSGSESNLTAFSIFVGVSFLIVILYFIFQLSRARARARRRMVSTPVEDESKTPVGSR